MGEIMALEAHDLYRFFHTGDDETLALRGVSLEIAPGELVAVTGPSGSGKSTLLNCLAGLDVPDGGWVSIEGRRISRLPERARSRVRAERIGLVMQSGNLFNHLTVHGNLALAFTMTHAPGTLDLPASLGAVGMAHRATAYPNELSGGERARAAIALATLHHPAILLADEPTAELDRANEEAVLSAFRERALAGQATLVATHSQRVMATADRIIRLQDGRVLGA